MNKIEFSNGKTLDLAKDLDFYGSQIIRLFQLPRNNVERKRSRIIGRRLRIKSISHPKHQFLGLKTCGLKYVGTKIGDSGLKYLAQGLATNTTLESLRLEENSITGEGLKVLCGVLAENTTLTELLLAGVASGPETLKLKMQIQQALTRNKVQASQPKSQTTESKPQIISSSFVPICLPQQVDAKCSINSVNESDYLIKDKIEVLSSLGKGEHGEVFKGKWLGTTVALKTLSDKSDMDNFLKEFNILL